MEPKKAQEGQITGDIIDTSVLRDQVVGSFFLSNNLVGTGAAA